MALTSAEIWRSGFWSASRRDDRQQATFHRHGNPDVDLSVPQDKNFRSTKHSGWGIGAIVERHRLDDEIVDRELFVLRHDLV
jgi:hypothetical protein